MSAERCDHLRHALAPFAAYAAVLLAQMEARDTPLRDADVVWKLNDTPLTVGDLRRAVEAMEEVRVE